MKNILMVIVVLIFTATVAGAQGDKCDLKLRNSEWGNIVFDNTNGISQYQGKNLEGNVCSYSESGKLESETPYKNGEKDGIAKSYRENGKLWLSFINKNGNAVSGICYNSSGSQTPLTNAEIANWNNGFDVTCE